jgi:hypothetical protein
MTQNLMIIHIVEWPILEVVGHIQVVAGFYLHGILIFQILRTK